MFLPNKHSFSLVNPRTKKFGVGVKSVIHPVRSLARAKGTSPEDLGEATSNGIQSGIQESAHSEPARLTDSPRFAGEAGASSVARVESATSLPSSSPDSDRRMFLPNKYSFLLVSTKAASFLPDTENVTVAISQSTDGEQSKVNDQGKRTFLKVAGIAGAGLIASLFLPKKSEALILGSSPTTGVVGVKNASNTRINPATEETVSQISSFSDSGNVAKRGLVDADRHVQVDVLTVPDSSFSDSGNVAKKALVDDTTRRAQVDVITSALPSSASTETTLQTISFGGKKYALKMTTVGDVDYIAEADTGTATSAALWRAKKVDSTSGIRITWADGNANFDNVATDLTTLNYS